MPGILDLLKKATGVGGDSPSSTPQGNQDGGIDIGKMAQDSADSAKAAQFKGAPYPQAPPKTPYPKGLSSTMTPQTSNGGTKGK